MSLFNLLGFGGNAVQTADHRELVSRYQRLREVGMNLNSKLVNQLSKSVLDEGAKKLEFLQRGVFVFDSENDMAVLMDYCLYDVRRNGRTAIERYLSDSPPEPESDEMTCLKAMQQATYSLIMVEANVRGVGAMVRDVQSNELQLLIDLGLASSAKPGMVLASRLLPQDGFIMTSGASLPVGIVPPDQLDTVIKVLLSTTTTDETGRLDPAPIIRALLKSGRSAHIEYQDATDGAVRRHRSGETTRSTRVSRNAPCPCGSGKKFKHCCLPQS